MKEEVPAIQLAQGSLQSETKSGLSFPSCRKINEYEALVKSWNKHGAQGASLSSQFSSWQLHQLLLYSFGHLKELDMYHCLASIWRHEVKSGHFCPNNRILYPSWLAGHMLLECVKSD